MRVNKKRIVITIGYTGGLAPHVLASILILFKATLWDVRRNPISRNYHWHRRNLEPRLNAIQPGLYEWHGDTLGGLGRKPTPEGINKLRNRKGPVLLLCQELAPAECHRHEIALALGEPVWHICGEDVVLATELQRSIDDDDDYECLPIRDFLDKFEEADAT